MTIPETQPCFRESQPFAVFSEVLKLVLVNPELSIQFASARKFDRLTYMEALERRLRVMDTTALSLCMDNKLPIIVFDLTNESNLPRLVEGDRTVGPLVS